MRALSALVFGALLVCAPGATAEWQVTGRVGGSISAVAAHGSLLCVGVGSRLHFYDVADSSSPREVGSTPPFGDAVLDVVVNGSRAYVAAGTDGVHILDISDPASPRLIGQWNSPGSAEGIAIDGTSLFVADGPFGLHIVDIANAALPARVASVYETRFIFDVAVQPPYAFLAGADAGLLVADVGTRNDPRELLTVDTPGFARDISIEGATLCLADQWGGVRVFSIAQPSFPREVSAVALPSWHSPSFSRGRRYTWLMARKDCARSTSPIPRGHGRSVPTPFPRGCRGSSRSRMVEPSSASAPTACA